MSDEITRRNLFGRIAAALLGAGAAAAEKELPVVAPPEVPNYPEPSRQPAVEIVSDPDCCPQCGRKLVVTNGTGFCWMTCPTCSAIRSDSRSALGTTTESFEKGDLLAWDVTRGTFSRSKRGER